MVSRGDGMVSDRWVLSLVFVAIVISIMGTYLIYTSSISVVNSPPVGSLAQSEIRESGQILLVVNPPVSINLNTTNDSRDASR